MVTEMIKLSTKPLNDGSTGIRFALSLPFVGQVTGIYRKRLIKTRGWKIEHLSKMVALHLGKRTLYLEQFRNRKTVRKFTNSFAK